MSKLKKPINFETIFDTYTVDELIGEGGAGRVYGGRDVGGGAIAVKLLTPDRATADRRRRFKNEVAFQSSIKHANIVSVIDNGVASGPDASGPFYIMRRYHGNLRDFIQQGIAPKAVLQLFSQILDGVEAAHLQGVIHRDLKPENILTDAESRNLAIADFGIARFTEDLVATAQTDPHQRLANFQYAAPEQRVPGRSVGVPADIYALALILNEMFTRTVAHGTDFKLIASVDDEFAFLDEIVKKMLKQVPEERPSSVAEVKALIQRHMAEAVSFQRLSEINGRVIKATEVDEPLAEIPPKLIAADWDGEILTLELDKPVTPEWIQALHSMAPTVLC